MTTMVKVTGLTVNDARQCLLAALGYLEKIEDQSNISLMVTPNYYSANAHSTEQTPENEPYTFSLQKNGKVG